jgi:hypothetical protein
MNTTQATNGIGYTNTKGTLENGIEVYIQHTSKTPGLERAFRREERTATRHAPGVGYATVSLSIWKSDDCKTFYVTWVMNKGNGWGKSFKKSGFATELEAFAFADAKWEVCIKVLGEVEVKASGFGAAEAFSAQVAGMHR